MDTRITRAVRTPTVRRRTLVVLPVLLCSLVLAACHQAFGTAPHGGPGTGTKGIGVTAIRDVRTATHAGYDRVVFEFRGNGVPRYDVAYVPASALVEHYPGGETARIPVKGTHFLKIVFDVSALDHGGHHGLTPNFRQIKEIKLVSSYLGLEYGVGVARQSGFRVFALTNPDRIVLDVRH